MTVKHIVAHIITQVLPLIEWVDNRCRAEFIRPATCIRVTGLDEMPLVE